VGKKHSSRTVTSQHVDRLKTALDIFQREYDSEHERVGTFEGRSGFLLTLGGALLVYTGQSFTAPRYNEFSALLILLQVLSILAILATVLSMIMVIRVRTFHRVNYNRLFSDDFLESNDHEFITQIIMDYQIAILETSTAIESRTKWFNRGIWILFAGLILVTITRLITIYSGG